MLLNIEESRGFLGLITQEKVFINNEKYNWLWYLFLCEGTCNFYSCRMCWMEMGWKPNVNWESRKLQKSSIYWDIELLNVLKSSQFYVCDKFFIKNA